MPWCSEPDFPVCDQERAAQCVAELEARLQCIKQEDERTWKDLTQISSTELTQLCTVHRLNPDLGCFDGSPDLEGMMLELDSWQMVRRTFALLNQGVPERFDAVNELLDQHPEQAKATAHWLSDETLLMALVKSLYHYPDPTTLEAVELTKRLLAMGCDPNAGMKPSGISSRCDA